MSKLKAYYALVKPGIIYGNILTAAGGFFLASRGHFDPQLFFAALIGLALVIASGCVFNNYIDRDIDRLMARTKYRALAGGTISGKTALIYATSLGICGTLVLSAGTNLLATGAALLGLFAYLVLYSLWAKRYSAYGTHVGSISGAMPSVVGYLAASNNLDAAAVILFFILILWQMPHFFAIAIYGADDYAAAGIPVLPLKSGLHATKIQMVLYILGFTAAALSLAAWGYAGYLYGAVLGTLGLIWLWLGLKGFRTRDDKLWARSMFKLSLIVITLFSVAIAVDALLENPASGLF